MSKVKKRALFIALAVLLMALPAYAALRSELTDEDGDGRKETEFFYDGDKVTQALVDKNGDGKPDKDIKFKAGKRFSGEEDNDYDGKTDTWNTYDAEGHLKRSAKDSNQDGKPDQFREMLKGRNLVLRDLDRNFDGKIDRRALTEWKPDKKLTTFINGRPQSTPMPGYVTLWSEEDNDYDGKIDVYRERGNPNPSTERIGKPIDHEVKI